MSDLVEEFLARGGKVTELAPGATAPFRTITGKASDHKTTMAAGDRRFKDPSYIRRNKEKPKSGYNNIKIQKTTIAVYLGHGVHKTFPKGDDEAAALKAALACRDKCREAMGLPPAEF